MLTLWAGQVETLWDEALPIEVRELPEDLAQLDLLLGGEELFAPIVAHWQREVAETDRAQRAPHRPRAIPHPPRLLPDELRELATLPRERPHPG